MRTTKMEEERRRKILRGPEGSEHAQNFDEVEVYRGKESGESDEDILRKDPKHNLTFEYVKNQEKKEAQRLARSLKSDEIPLMTKGQAYIEAEKMVERFRQGLIDSGELGTEIKRKTKGLVERYVKDMDSLIIKEDGTDNDPILADQVPDADEVTQEDLNRWYKQQGWTD